MLGAVSSGFLNLSDISVWRPVSLLREEVVLEYQDRLSLYRKYEKQMDIYMRREGADEHVVDCYFLMRALDRPWEEAMDKPLKYGPEDLMKRYAEEFPEELKET